MTYDRTHLFQRSYEQSLADAIDKNAIIENDGRSSTRTFFYPDEGEYPNEVVRARMWRIMKLNDGVQEKGRSTANYRADVRRFCGTVCSQLEMTNYQKSRVEHVMMEMSLNSFGPYSAEKIAMAVISLVANEDRRLVRDEDMFQSLLKDVGSSLSECKRLRQMVLDRTDAFEQ